MFTKINIILCFLLLIIIPASLHGSGLHVALDDPIYLYLDRLATQGIIRDLLNDTAPLKRDEIAQFLLKIYQRKDELSFVDRQILEEYIADYYYELSGLKHFTLGDTGTVYFSLGSLKNIHADLKDLFTYQEKQADQHLFVYETDNEMVWIDWDEMVRLETKNGLTRRVEHDGFRISSQIGKNFCLYMDAYRYRQVYTKDFIEPIKENKNYYTKLQEEKGLYCSDKSDAYIKYSSKLGDFSLASLPLYWGNSSNSLLLSNTASSFGFIQWQRHFYKSKFTFIHASLLPAESYYDSLSQRKAYAEKYMVGHRLEIIPFPKLHFTFSEMFFYGNRSPDLVYLVPVVFLRPTEHNLKDRDNATLAAEFECFPKDKLKVYGTLFLDELKASELGKKWWANKHGYQLGIHITPRLHRLSTEFSLEFTAVKPWTYTHKYPVSSCTHDSIGLGFYGGPNSQLWFAENRWWLSKKQIFTLTYRQLKHGVEEDYYPIGSNPNQNYNERNRDFDHATKFLMGKIITTEDYSFHWLYQWRNEISFIFEYNYRKINNDSYNYLSFQLRVDY